MASSKDTFEPATFGATSFASGTWRGIGVATATIVGTWSRVIACYSDQPRITIAATTKTGELHAGSGTVEIS